MALERAETEWTQWRYDGTLPGIAARIADGVGREVGLWVGREGYGHDGRTVQVYVKGRNGQLTFGAGMTADEARRLAASLTAMADFADAQPLPSWAQQTAQPG